MSPSPLKSFAAALVCSALTLVPMYTAAEAGNYSQQGGGNFGGKPGCTSCCGSVTVNKPVNIYKPVTINKNINVYKPTTINKNINVYKPVTINKDINIYKPVTINKDINITKTIDASKNITINKNIEINKSIVINKGSGGSSAEASAFAQALAQASANASASASSNVVVYGGGYNEYVTVNNRAGGDIGTVQTSAQCEMQDANVVKAIHAVCVSPDGREFPASHMVGDTWIDAPYEGEILRCIPGAHLKVTIGDVLQTDQGMAGTYASGQTIECSENEALRHYKDGMVKCAPKVWVKDCTERSNLRRWGTADMFFSYRATVCVTPRTAAAPRELDVTGMTLEGGVGDESGN